MTAGTGLRRDPFTWVLLAVPAAVAVAGFALTSGTPRYGLVVIAIVLGWTQLAGL